MWDFRKYKDNTAALDDLGNKILYGDLKELELEFQELCHRKLVFILCKNVIGSFAGYAAMLNAGTIPLLLSSDIDANLLGRLMDIYEPDFIWLPSDKNDMLINTECVFERYGYCLIKTAFKAYENIYEDLALLLSTSGSTGSPKCVRQSYQNMKANTESIVQYLQIDSTERPITTLPMNYTYGLSIINTHLYTGATVLLTDKTLMQKEFWEFFKRENATSFGGVPYIYEILNKLRFFKMELPSLRYMTQAGGKLAPKLHEEFARYARDTGRKFSVMYGQTEATARMAYLPADKAVEKYGSMGIAIPGGKFQLVDLEGNIIEEPETAGELVYEGENVTLGYAEQRSDLAKGDERKGRLITGDIAKRDKDGFYYIVGRRKRFLKVFGKRINLDEVDRLVKEKYENTDCASTGVDDHIHIFVTDQDIAKEAGNFIAEMIHINRSAITLRFIEKIPRNDSGKIIYAELNE